MYFPLTNVMLLQYYFYTASFCSTQKFAFCFICNVCQYIYTIEPYAFHSVFPREKFVIH